ncbi:MAG: iron-containing alcohol dehydrogenase [Holophagales bacterium]|nr:iron-containing alcohol dehydrogenase [Holophagales bacterium]
MIGFRMPTHVHIQTGAISRLPEAARSLDIHSALVVVDPGLREHTEWPTAVVEALEGTGIRTRVFDSLESNPRTTTATAAAEQLKEHGLDGVVALGGGSTLDTAKAAAMLATNSLKIEQYEGKNRYADPPRPMIAVPTTCGAGSEVTWVSVLTHVPTRSKISIKGDSMFPDQAQVDPELLRSLPRELVAWTSLDALTHALECVTCTARNPVSDALASRAAELIFRFLPRAVADIDGDREARESIMLASTLAGLAFGNADVAAVHCLSEAIGGLHDAPHGLTNAVLLAPVMRFHRAYIADRLAWLDDVVFGGRGGSVEERSEHFLEALELLCDSVGTPPFSSLGILPREHQRLAEAAVRNGSNRSNPQPMSPVSYRRILEQLGDPGSAGGEPATS